MGGGGSNLLAGTDKAGSKQETVASYHLIGLKNHEVKQLKRVFQKLDVMKKGSLDLRAIYSYFCLEDNVYMTHIFHRVQREDAKGTVFDFFLLGHCSSYNLPEIYAQEFVLCASYFLMLSRDALIGISLYST